MGAIITFTILITICVVGAIASAHTHGRNDVLNDMFLKGDITLEIRNKWKS